MLVFFDMAEFRAACVRDLGMIDSGDEAVDGSHAVAGMVDPQNAANRLYGRAGEALAAASKRLR